MSSLSLQAHLNPAGKILYDIEIDSIVAVIFKKKNDFPSQE